MSKLRLTFDTVQYINLRDSVSFGPIARSVLSERFKDGRLFGLLAEDLICSHFSNIIKTESNTTKGFDLIANEIGKIEVKSFTKNGCDVSPSFMKGIGRSFDESNYNEFLDGISGICICDNIDFPDVYIILKHPDFFLAKRKIHVSERFNLFQLEE